MNRSTDRSAVFYSQASTSGARRSDRQSLQPPCFPGPTDRSPRTPGRPAGRRGVWSGVGREQGGFLLGVM